MLATTLLQHPLSGPDRAAMAQMRAATAPFKGKLAGLPPAPLQVGDDEVPLDDAVRWPVTGRRAGLR